MHYFFAGKAQIDLVLTLEILNRELGVKRLLVEGGGTTNMAFLCARLVDEMNLIVCPGVDGTKGAPSAFDTGEADGGQPAPLKAMTLEAAKRWTAAPCHLRYRSRTKSPKLPNSRSWLAERFSDADNNSGIALRHGLHRIG